MGELLGELITQFIPQPLGEFMGELLTQLIPQLMGELLGEPFTQPLGELSGFGRISDGGKGLTREARIKVYDWKERGGVESILKRIANEAFGLTV
jgi:hypothetical protein